MGLVSWVVKLSPLVVVVVKVENLSFFENVAAFL
jgi:hypothetical protein